MARKMVLQFAKWINGSQNGFMVLKMVVCFAIWMYGSQNGFTVRKMVYGSPNDSMLRKMFFFWLENGFTVRKMFLWLAKWFYNYYPRIGV